MKNQSCASPSEASALDVVTARQRILETLSALTDTEHVTLRAALGRVLAASVHAAHSVPPHDNSAMDGYALCSADLPGNGTKSLAVIGTAYAGAPYLSPVHAGECVRIMTGAVIPPGCDTVVMQEQVEPQADDRVSIQSGHRGGEHVRKAGEDLMAGDRVLSPGRRLTPADLGLIASLGLDKVGVVRQPRVAMFTSGDELREIGTKLPTGCIYDSNRYTLYGMLKQLGIEPIELGIVADRRDALKATLRHAAAHADVIISTGGVSVGEADYVRDTLAELGNVHFWKVGMRPGRPFAFGAIAEAWFFGLPGNPVSTMATFHQFVQPALRRLAGEQNLATLRLQVPCITPLKKRPGRMEFQRGILESDANGHTVVRSTGEQGSGILSSMSKANCFIILPVECGDVTTGTLVDVQPFQ